MKTVVTGGSGFIGSVFVWRLNLAGINEILVVDEFEETKRKNLEGKRIKDCLEKDVFPEKLFSGKLGRIDLLVHLGACSSTTERDEAYLKENNYLYSRRLAEWALERNVPFYYASSAATYGQGELGFCDDDQVTLKLKPLNPYGWSKQLFDLWVVENGLAQKVTGFKFFNVFGPNEYHKREMRSVVLKTYERIKKEGKACLFKSYRPDFAHGEQKRDFVYVKDAVEVMWYFVTHPEKKGIFNVGTGQARSFNDLVNALFAALGMKPRIEYIEMPENIRKQYQYFTQADLRKLRQAGCQYRFRELEESVAEYAKFLEQSAYL
ncbi:MAG: ADP-glyceromanno-heptose 6-epimerase [Candidatus Omnitrophica bacterium]|nr:ADP-glyceromanno-heptose 6-epimerase [Candidatus Omnitrophota bacterium]